MTLIPPHNGIIPSAGELHAVQDLRVFLTLAESLRDSEAAVASIKCLNNAVVPSKDAFRIFMSIGGPERTAALLSVRREN